MRIPFIPDQKTADPLLRIVQIVGARTGLSPQHAAVIISHFWEGVADEVSKGRSVSIPGLGIFSPVTRTARSRETGEMVTTVVIKFSAARGFREQVRFGAPPNQEGGRRYTRHMRNHALGGPESRCSERAFTAARAFRQAIADQLGGGEIEFD